MKPIPEIGKFYHFFDDGKTSPGRHYICKVERILTMDEAKNEPIVVPNWAECLERDDLTYTLTTIYDNWQDEIERCDWLFDTETDYFIECSCPKYDENNLWFVRTKDGGWFSMDIQSSWQGGTLDVTGDIFESVVSEIRDNPKWYDQDIINAYMEETYE